MLCRTLPFCRSTGNKKGRPATLPDGPFALGRMCVAYGQVTHAPMTAASGMSARTTGKICFMSAALACVGSSLKMLRPPEGCALLNEKVKNS